MAGEYDLDPAHTFADFVAQHTGVGQVRGRFERVARRIMIADDSTKPSIEVAIQTASIGHEQRNAR
jgi:polyisoprenoid-binding protein YceI